MGATKITTATNSNGFGERIRQARREANLTQSVLAQRMGVSGRAVQSWEQGTRSPRSNLLRSLSQVTGKPMSWFFEEDAA